MPSIQVLHEPGVREPDVRAASNAVAALVGQFPALEAGGFSVYDGGVGNVWNRRDYAHRVDEWIRENWTAAECASTVFLHLANTRLRDYAFDALRGDVDVDGLLGAGITTRVAGPPDDAGYRHGLSVVNTSVREFVRFLPVALDHDEAVTVTALHELGHAMVDGVPVDSDHRLGAQLDEADGGTVTPMLYWYGDGLHRWARNPCEAPDASVCETRDVETQRRDYSEAMRDQVEDHLDYWFDG